MSKKVRTAKTGKEIASCFRTSSDSHHRKIRARIMRVQLLLALVATGALVAACDPVMGTGSGTQPDPKQYLKTDQTTRTASVTLIAGYPATDYQFNYDGYQSGALVLTVPIGWQMTVQCSNHSTVPQSCAVVTDGSATQALRPDWSTPDPVRGLDPGQSASFVFTPTATGDYRIASLVPGSEASGMWLELKIVASGRPSLSATSA